MIFTRRFLLWIAWNIRLFEYVFQRYVDHLFVDVVFFVVQFFPISSSSLFSTSGLRPNSRKALSKLAPLSVVVTPILLKASFFNTTQRLNIFNSVMPTISFKWKRVLDWSHLKYTKLQNFKNTKISRFSWATICFRRTTATGLVILCFCCLSERSNFAIKTFQILWVILLRTENDSIFMLLSEYILLIKNYLDVTTCVEPWKFFQHLQSSYCYRTPHFYLFWNRVIPYENVQNLLRPSHGF